MTGLDQPAEDAVQRDELAPMGGASLRDGVAEELERIERQKANTAQGILLLAFTAFLFAGLHLLQEVNWVVVALLLAVLTFHELGHLLAMRAFGYQDTRMFFIPFFGAAAAGSKHDATGTQRAIVLLAGPLPGLVVGFALLCVLAVTGTHSVALFTLIGLLLYINAFNLLPFQPLDGGRFMATVLFSRKPGLEALVRVVGALMLALIAFALSSWVLGVLALFMLLATPLTLSIARAAGSLAAEIPPAELSSPRIPPERRALVAHLVETRVEPQPRAFKPRSFASMMQTLWLRAQERPPSVGHTAVLLAVYLLFAGGAGAFGWIVWRDSSFERGPEEQTQLVSQHVAGMVPGTWQKLDESPEGEAPWFVRFQRGDGGSLSVVLAGVSPLERTELDRLEAEWRRKQTVTSREALPGGGMLWKGTTEDGLALRTHVLDRNGLAWIVTYVEVGSPTEDDVDLRAQAVLSGLEMR